MPIWEMLQQAWAEAGAQDARYLHVVVNHLPVTGLLVATLVLLGALPFRRRGLVLAAMALVMVFSLSAWPAVYYGEEGFHLAEEELPQAGVAWLKTHRALAERWKWLFYATGGVALVGFVLGLWRRRSLYASVPLVLLLSAGSLVAGVAISEAGGRAAHGEFRSGPPPKLDGEAADHDHDHHHEGHGGHAE